MNIKPIADIPSPKLAVRAPVATPNFAPQETFGYSVSYSFQSQKPVFSEQPSASATEVANPQPESNSAVVTPRCENQALIGSIVQEFPAPIEPTKFPGVSLFDQLKARVGFDPVGMQRLELKEVEFYENQFAELKTPAQFQAQSAQFRNALKSGTSLEEIRPQAYALARVVAKQTLKKRPYDSQLLGALAMESKSVVQMERAKVRP